MCGSSRCWTSAWDLLRVWAEIICAEKAVDNSRDVRLGREPWKTLGLKGHFGAFQSLMNCPQEACLDRAQLAHNGASTEKSSRIVVCWLFIWSFTRDQRNPIIDSSQNEDPNILTNLLTEYLLTHPLHYISKKYKTYNISIVKSQQDHWHPKLSLSPPSTHRPRFVATMMASHGHQTPGAKTGGASCRPGQLDIVSMLVGLKNMLVGGLEHQFYFPMTLGNNHPNWLSYVSEGWNHQPEYVG